MTKIKITVDNLTLKGELNDSPAATAIKESLPITARGNLWGDEIYFGIDARVKDPDTVPVVNVGDLAFWGPGNAFCIFYGRTPASIGDEPRAASPVNVVGKIIGDPLILKTVKRSPQVKIELA